MGCDPTVTASTGEAPCFLGAPGEEQGAEQGGESRASRHLLPADLGLSVLLFKRDPPGSRHLFL